MGAFCIGQLKSLGVGGWLVERLVGSIRANVIMSKLNSTAEQPLLARSGTQASTFDKEGR